MPNWIDNYLQIIGPSEDIAAIVKDLNITDGRIDFNNILPCPQELRDTNTLHQDTDKRIANIEKYGEPDWYEWCLNNWGTKWSAWDAGIVYHQKQIHAIFEFVTANSPPYNLLEFLSIKYPEVCFINACFDYFGGWQGFFILVDGKESNGNSESYNYDCEQAHETYVPHELRDSERREMIVKLKNSISDEKNELSESKSGVVMLIK